MIDLQVALFQTHIHWEAASLNFEHFEKYLMSIDNVDVVVLPEMFSTGFSMESKRLAEPFPGPALEWMQHWSQRKEVLLLGSVMVEDAGAYYNRLYATFPDGTYHYYNKRHLFRMASEDSYFSSGEKKLILTYKGWRICPLICYDLRFPVWSRNQSDYDVLVYVANWPEVRVDAWNALLKARAIENQCYVLGVNRVGTDGKQIAYSGGSVVHDSRGSLLAAGVDGQESIVQAKLSWNDLNDFRKKFPVALDADEFELRI